MIKLMRALKFLVVISQLADIGWNLSQRPYGDFSIQDQRLSFMIDLDRPKVDAIVGIPPESEVKENMDGQIYTTYTWRGRDGLMKLTFAPDGKAFVHETAPIPSLTGYMVTKMLYW